MGSEALDVVYPLDRRDMATIVAINSRDATTPQKNLQFVFSIGTTSNHSRGLPRTRGTPQNNFFPGGCTGVC
jgi:hypothetical protein